MTMGSSIIIGLMAGWYRAAYLGVGEEREDRSGGEYRQATAPHKLRCGILFRDRSWSLPSPLIGVDKL